MKKLLPLLIIALACLSCSPPPFDLSLSQSAATINKLTKDNTSAIATSFYYDSTEQNFVFYPQVLATGFDYSAGFVTSRQGLAIDVRGVSLGAGTTQLSQYSELPGDMPNPDAQSPAYSVWPTKGGSSYLFGTVFDAITPGASYFALFFGNAAGHTMAPLTSGGLTPRIGVDLPNVTVIGSSVSTLPSPSADSLHWLARQTSGTDFVEATYLLGAGVLSFSGSQRGATPWALPFLPAGITRVMYYYDENAAGDPGRSPNRSYASWYDAGSGSWKCATWWGTSAADWKMLSGVTTRIDALLSNGDLLSVQAGTGKVYDRDGKVLASFPMGSLVYLGEQYVGGSARAYFEQGFLSDNLWHFNVYWINTDQITTLGN